MDVLNSKPQYGLFRRRLRIQTPEINTYHRQILLCEKSCDNISKKFYKQDAKERENTTRLSSQFPLMGRGSSNSFTARTNGRRDSKEQLQYHRGSCISMSSSQLHMTYKRNNNASSPSRKKSLTNMISKSTTEIAKAPEVERQIRQYRRSYSRRQSEMSRIGLVKEYSPEKTGAQHEKTVTRKELNSEATTGNLEEMNSVVDREREYFLRALTTLAINRMTVDVSDCITANANERPTTHANYERNISVLADTARPILHDRHYYLNDDAFERTPATTSSPTTSELYDDSIDDHVEYVGKRQRINKLRNYLKSTGFGDADIITTTTEQSEDEKRALNRLIRRINRGVSLEKQDRLGRKARLDYEMSLMKGESFCEQQEQAYMRTASADMENRDLQMLEDELRIKALEEIRQNDKEVNKKQNTQRRRNLIRKDSNASDLLKHQNANATAEGGEKADGGVEDKENNQNEDETASVNDDREDAMSGLIRHPLSRREMQKRILLWIFDVEEATGIKAQEDQQRESRLVRKQFRQSAFIREDKNIDDPPMFDNTDGGERNEQVEEVSNEK